MNIGYCETQKTINTDFSLSVHLHAYYSTTKFNIVKMPNNYSDKSSDW